MDDLPTEPFWMVWTPAGMAPTVKHATRELAEKEAKRLARKLPGELFVILEAVGALVKREFDTVVLKAPRNPDDDVPF